LAHTDESIFDVDETGHENYNIRSAERTELLIQLKGLSEDRPVSPGLWACCQLCDKRRLPVLIDLVSVDPGALLGYEKSLASVPLLCNLVVLRPHYGFDCKCSRLASPPSSVRGDAA
jgi:hypothetical protein